MKSTVNINQILFFTMAFVFGANARSAEIDCSKFTESLCNSVKAKLDADTIYVNIFLRLPRVPGDDSSCKDVDIRAYPTSACGKSGYDSIFWAKLKSETEDEYAKYAEVMMDVKSPSQKISYPGDSSGGFWGVVVTKATLITISQDTNIVTVEPFFEKHPINLVSPLRAAQASSETTKYLQFLINGRIQSATKPSRSIRIMVRR